MIENEDADIERVGLHGVSFSCDEFVHSFHDDLEGVRVDLSDGGAEAGENTSKKFD